MIDAADLHLRAQLLADEHLDRKRALLDTVDSEERRAIEEAAHAVAIGVANCLLEEALRCPPLAAALTGDSDAG